MKRITAICLLWFSSFIATAAESYAEKNAAFATELDLLIDQHLTNIAQSAIIDRIYSAHFSADHPLPKWTSTAAVAIIFDNAFKAHFYTHHLKYLAVMENSFEQLALARALEARHVERLYSSYITVRKFEKAKILARHYWHESASFPEVLDQTVSDNNERKIWRLEDDGRALRSETYVPPAGLSIVVLTSAECHFSIRFQDELQSNVELANALGRNVLYLQPPGPALSIDETNIWNHARPRSQIVLADQRSDWPEISYWETPVFVFYYDGKLVKQINGWPRAGRAMELIDAANSIRNNGSRMKNDS